MSISDLKEGLTNNNFSFLSDLYYQIHEISSNLFSDTAVIIPYTDIGSSQDMLDTTWFEHNFSGINDSEIDSLSVDGNANRFLKMVGDSYFDTYYFGMNITVDRMNNLALKEKLAEFIYAFKKKALVKPRKIYYQAGKLNNHFYVYTVVFASTTIPVILKTPYHLFKFGKFDQEYLKNIVNLDQSVSDQDLLKKLKNIFDPNNRPMKSYLEDDDEYTMLPCTLEFVYYLANNHSPHTDMRIAIAGDDKEDQKDFKDNLVKSYPQFLSYLADLI